MTVPASAFVNIIPGVLGAGGLGLDLNGLFLTANAAVPIGSVAPFSNPTDVGSFFGLASAEYAAAGIYFAGYDNSTKKPGNLIFAQYNTAAVAGYLRGGTVAGMTLAQLQAIPAGTLTVLIDGVSYTSASITLSGAASFTAAAALINTAIAHGVTTYDAQRAAFVITSATTGAASSVSFATGAIATALNLTTTTGAVQSPGAVVATPVAAMSAIALLTQNWFSFTTVAFEPVIADKTSFSIWASGQNKRFAYVGWDTDANAAIAGNTTSWGALTQASNYDGSIPVYKDPNVAYFICGMVASIDFERTNARITCAYKSQAGNGQAGLTPTVTSQTLMNTLNANGYNCYVSAATAAQNFNFLYSGQISGEFDWIDEYANQVWLNSALQLALLSLLTTIGSIPYNADGDTILAATALGPINDALNFGAIRAGVQLSTAQAVEVNTAAGVTISQTLQTRGWYFQSNAAGASAQVRAARGSPECTLWYMDGGAIQSITVASVAIA